MAKWIFALLLVASGGAAWDGARTDSSVGQSLHPGGCEPTNVAV